MQTSPYKYYNNRKSTWEKIMKFKYRCLALSLLLVSALSFAHSGGTDSQGCHVDHKTGVRHCH
ncbi:hypothetical protein FB598_2896 [Herbaspirillum sp. SJZ106]|nr:hypothetical protein FB598_2896 [Herbaspirillum sp. SJZ106]